MIEREARQPEKPHYDLKVLQTQVARDLARFGLASDRQRKPPTKEWGESEWEERILDCIPQAEELHARKIAMILVENIKRVLTPPPPSPVMVIRHKPTYEDLERRVKELEEAIQPIAAETYAMGLQSAQFGHKVSDNADLFSLAPGILAKSKMSVGMLRTLYLVVGNKLR